MTLCVIDGKQCNCQPSEGVPCTAGNAAEVQGALWSEIIRLRIGHNRYETARRMSPKQWAEAWKLNVTTGKPFDEIIDDITKGKE